PDHRSRGANSRARGRQAAASASTVPAHRRGPVPHDRSARSSSGPESPAAARRRCRPLPAASCPRAASADARRSPPLSDSLSEWVEKTATTAWDNSRNQWDTGRGAVKPDRVPKYKAGSCEKRPKRRIFGPFLGLVVLMPSQRRHTPAKAGYAVVRRMGGAKRYPSSIEPSATGIDGYRFAPPILQVICDP